MAEDLPKDIVLRLNSEIAKLMTAPDARERIAVLGADIMTSTPEAIRHLYKTGQVKWGQAITDTGARLD